MADSQLATLQRLRKKNEEQAALMLGSAQGELANQQQKLDQLRQYLNDYSALSGSGQASSGQTRMSVQKIRGLSNFCEQINSAIQVQALEIKKYERSVEECMTIWQTTYRELESIKALIDQQRAQELQQQARDEKTREDELVSIAYTYRSKSHGG